MNSQARWANAVRAFHCLAAAPGGAIGLHLRARAGDTRQAWLDAFDARCDVDPGRLHPQIDDLALFGGLDVAETLRLGRPVERDGLLTRHRLFILAMAERAEPGLAARLGQALDSGGVTLIALDEGCDADETLDAGLADRLALYLDLDGLRAADMPCLSPLELGEPVEDPLAQLTALAMSLGIGSLRAPIQALQVAAASAALDGRAVANSADLAFAAQTVLAPRATQLPAPPPEAEEDTAEQDTAPEPAPSPDDSITAPHDVVLEAAMAALPPHLLEALAKGTTPRAQGSGAGAKRKGNRRGRPLPSRHGRMDGRARIDIVATLRAAAPWQKLRGRVAGAPVALRASDIRLKRYETRSDRLVIFAVDASGSAAFARLAEAKGAVELLLADAYARRDHVALIGFRGEGANLLLPPTRSLVRTKRELGQMAGGGGTPLAAGLRESVALAHSARARGMDPALVVLTDGRPNIALSGTASRAEAAQDADAMSGLVRAANLSGLVIDTGNRATPALAVLAAKMGATCLPLPRADAHGLSHAVADAL